VAAAKTPADRHADRDQQDDEDVHHGMKNRFPPHLSSLAHLLH
jgi:hypothetical protein